MANSNDKIVERLLKIIKNQTEGMPENHYWQYVSAMEEEGNNEDPRIINSNIIKAFPWPVGVELRRLFSADRIEQNKERMDQALKVAEKCTQFLALILLAQLWDEMKLDKAKTNADFDNQFKDFDKPSFGIWAGLVRSMHSIFETCSITPFTEHFSNQYFSGKSFLKQLAELVEIRNRIVHDDQYPNPDALELLLTDFLCSISFLVKYKLVSVSKIEVRKSRLTKVSFSHSLRILNNQNEDFVSNDKNFELYFETPAVMLFKDFKSPNQHLNLSPLIIDTTAAVKNQRIDGIMPGIYVYNSKRNENYHYYFTDGREASPMNNHPLFNELQNEFNDLKNTLKYEKPV